MRVCAHSTEAIPKLDRAWLPHSHPRTLHAAKLLPPLPPQEQQPPSRRATSHRLGIYVHRPDAGVLVTPLNGQTQVVTLRTLQRDLQLDGVRDLARASVWLHFMAAHSKLNDGTRMMAADLHHARTLIDQGHSSDARSQLANGDAAAGEAGVTDENYFFEIPKN